MQVHTRAIFPYLLPRGLPVGVEVTVMSVEDGLCVIRDGRGKEWSVATVSVDPGQCVWKQGQWVLDAGYRPAA